MNTRDLLIEIGTEELPPKALANLSTALQHSLTEQLQALELSFGNVQRFASPRRLAVLIEELDEAQSRIGDGSDARSWYGLRRCQHLIGQSGNPSSGEGALPAER